MKNYLSTVSFIILVLSAKAMAEGSRAKHSGSLYVITTALGAELPSTASEKSFPLLVRLDKDFFDFSQAQAEGQDIRFTTGNGAPMAYQIEHWDAAHGTAGIWVRIPVIRGNERQEIKMHWGGARCIGAALMRRANPTGRPCSMRRMAT